MKNIDYHMHSYFSSDSEEIPRNHVIMAIEHHLDEICFTEHRDFHFPGELKFDLDVSDYFATIEKLQQEFLGEIKIKIGLEMGLDPLYQKEINDFVSASPYDFVIGSVHEIHNIEVFDNTGYYDNCTKDEAYKKYFESLLDVVEKFDCFNSLGHMDYVARYGPYRDKKVNFLYFSDILTQILKILVEKGKGLEVNTRLFDDLTTQKFYSFLLQAYSKLGGKIITLGTDSHIADRNWDNLTKARQLIYEAGFTELTSFTAMKAQNF